MRMEQLYERLAETQGSDFFQIEPDICAALSVQFSTEARPPWVTAFLVVSNWMAMSQRSGVWTFYEAWPREELQTALGFLKVSGKEELAAIFAAGIHDYQDPAYAENFDYPGSWLREADGIDDWITAHEDWLYAWKRALLLENRPC